MSNGRRSAAGVGLVRSSTTMTALVVPFAISARVGVPIGRRSMWRIASPLSAGVSVGPISTIPQDGGKSIVRGSSPEPCFGTQLYSTHNDLFIWKSEPVVDLELNSD